MSVSRAKPRGIRISGYIGLGNFTMQELRPHDETLCGGGIQGESAENLASGPFPRESTTKSVSPSYIFNVFPQIVHKTYKLHRLH
jgi:hypothetical protein